MHESSTITAAAWSPIAVILSLKLKSLPYVLSKHRNFGKRNQYALKEIISFELQPVVFVQAKFLPVRCRFFFFLIKQAGTSPSVSITRKLLSYY